MGYLATVFDSFAKPFPREQPWLDYWQVAGDASAGRVSISNVTLTNWTSSAACPTTALQSNPSSVDLDAVHQVPLFGLFTCSSQNFIAGRFDSGAYFFKNVRFLSGCTYLKRKYHAVRIVIL